MHTFIIVSQQCLHLKSDLAVYMVCSQTNSGINFTVCFSSNCMIVSFDYMNSFVVVNPIIFTLVSDLYFFLFEIVHEV